MGDSLAALDSKLEKRLKPIEELEAELFFERVKLAGLKAAKEALLREIVVRDKRDERYE